MGPQSQWAATDLAHFIVHCPLVRDERRGLRRDGIGNVAVHQGSLVRQHELQAYQLVLELHVAIEQVGRVRLVLAVVRFGPDFASSKASLEKSGLLS
jgi:hypothetical protein